jgi:predicted secreted protein
MSSEEVQVVDCYSTTNKSREASRFITLFIIILVFVWIILFTFNPTSVQKTVGEGEQPVENAPADPVKCFWGGAIISLIVILLIWAFTACWKK